MKTVQRFRVMWVDSDGNGQMNNDNFYTEAEAEEIKKDLQETFISEEYYVERYNKVVSPRYNHRAVDGWEDIYQYN